MADNHLSKLLPQAGALSKTAWDLPQNMTEADWKQAGSALSRVEGALMWWIGDWWTFGEHKYGKRKALVESDEWEGPSYQTCFNASNVCKKFESNRRRLSVPFGHHAEVASLPAEEADKILDWCEATQEEHGRLPTRKATRDRVKQVKAMLPQDFATPPGDADDLTQEEQRELAAIQENIETTISKIADLEDKAAKTQGGILGVPENDPLVTAIRTHNAILNRLNTAVELIGRQTHDLPALPESLREPYQAVWQRLSAHFQSIGAMQ